MRLPQTTIHGYEISVKGIFSGDFRECMIRYIPEFEKIYPMVLGGKLPTPEDVSRSLTDAQSKPHSIIAFAEDDLWYLAKQVPGARDVGGIISVLDRRRKVAEARFTCANPSYETELNAAVDVFLERTGIIEQ